MDIQHHTAYSVIFMHSPHNREKLCLFRDSKEDVLPVSRL